jgi:hypothetical protein
MDKTQLLTKLERAWSEFKASYAGLTDEQMVEPGVTGDWSVKDTLAHVSTWEEEALTHLPHILQGVRPPRYSITYGGIDAFNEQMTEKKRSLALADVKDQSDETHRRLVQYIDSLPDDLFTKENDFRRRLRLDTYSHYPIHTRLIRAWREQAG